MTLETHSQKKSKDLLVVLVDISGSMQGIKTDAEGGLTSFLNEQKGVAGGADLLLIEFDDRYIKHDLIDIDDFKSYKLEPRGMTALLDAIGKSIRDAEAIMSNGYNKVIFNIVTDGHENHSREFTRSLVREMIEDKQRGDWEFIFSAANMDAVAEAASIGIAAGSAMTFDACGAGAQVMYATCSDFVGTLRTGTKMQAEEGLKNAKSIHAEIS